MRSIPFGISSVGMAGVPCARRRASAIQWRAARLLSAVGASALLLQVAPAFAQGAPPFRPGHVDRPPLVVAELRLGAAVRDAPVAPASHPHKAAMAEAPTPLRRTLPAEMAAEQPGPEMAREAAAIAPSVATPVAVNKAVPVAGTVPVAGSLPVVQPAAAARLPAFIAAMQRLAPAPVPGTTPRPVAAGRAPVLTRAPLPLFPDSEPEVRIATRPPIRGSVTEGQAALDVSVTGALGQPGGTETGPAALAQAAPGQSAAGPGVTGQVAPALGPQALALSEMPKPRRSRPAAVKGGLRLQDAVASAVMSFPEIRINEARVREATAGIGISRAGLYPNADLRVAAGHNFSGNYEGRDVPYKTASGSLDNRLDAGLILRQLVFDFGATKSDIMRAEFLRDSEKLKLRDKVEEVAHRTTQSFLKVLEQREMLGLIDEIIAAHEHLSKVVEAHAREGHGTLADVNRVASRLTDVRAIRADISLQLMAAEEQFQRLTKRKASGLADVPDLGGALPKNPQEAIERVIAGSPRLGALAASRRSAQQELDFQRRSNLPRINLEIDGETKNFRSSDLGVVASPGRTQVEGRAMLAMRYRLMDGGLASATRDQINARIEGSDMTYLNEREQMEADVRQAYRAMESARRKGRLVSEGVAAADRVRDLYFEQFKGGKRTIFEMLDGQMAYYTARRNQIESQFEGRRAAFDVLRAMGALTSTLARGA